MPGSHITVAHSDSSRYAQVSVLAVHVVSSRSGIVAKPNAEVLDLGGRALWDLQVDKWHNVSLHLSKVTHLASLLLWCWQFRRWSSWTSWAGARSTRNDSWRQCNQGQKSSFCTRGWLPPWRWAVSCQSPRIPWAGIIDKENMSKIIVNSAIEDTRAWLWDSFRVKTYWRRYKLPMRYTCSCLSTIWCRIYVVKSGRGMSF